MQVFNNFYYQNVNYIKCKHYSKIKVQFLMDYIQCHFDNDSRVFTIHLYLESLS